MYPHIRKEQNRKTYSLKQLVEPRRLMVMKKKLRRVSLINVNNKELLNLKKRNKVRIECALYDLLSPLIFMKLL